MSVPYLRSAAVAATVLALAGLHQAAPAEAYSKTVNSKCRSDYRRLCPSYKVDTPGLDACMRSNYRAISNGCMRALVDAGLAPPNALKR